MARRPIRGGTLEQRLREGLRLLGTRADDADALARADALWLARVLPPMAPPTTAEMSGTTRPVLPAPASDPTVTRPEVGEHEFIGRGPAPPAPSPAAPADVRPLFVIQQGHDGEPMLNARRVQLPAAQALPGRADLERALRPFLRRRPSATRRTLDAPATAEASARASADLIAALGRIRGQVAVAPHALVPVLRPARERWFDVALLAEDDDTMRVFDDTVQEFQHLLAHHGAFGAVRLWRWSTADGEVRVSSASGQRGGPRAMLDPQRPQLILILTHGATPQWQREPLRRFVRMLSSSAVVAFVQLLPRRSWGHTALGAARQLVRTRSRAAINRQLQALDPWSGGFGPNTDGAQAVPILSLDACGLGEWAGWVMSSNWQGHEAVSIAPLRARPQAPDAGRQAGAPADPARSDGDTAREWVLRFRGMASGQAFALLRLMATSVITVPVMRLMLQSLPPPHLSSSMAEVLMSGLLARRSPADTPVSERVFEFRPGVREWLHAGLTGTERALADAASEASREAIRRFVERKSGKALKTFEALFEDPEGQALLPASAQAFVEVSARLHARRYPGAPVPPRAEPRRPLGPLHGFAPVAADLVDRPALAAALRSRIAALAPGERLTLRARAESGSRSLLATLLSEPAVRERFTGGVWFDKVPPPRRGHQDGPRLSFRPVEEKGPRGPQPASSPRGQDVEIRMRWTSRDIEVDIGWLDETEADAHLADMGLAPTHRAAARSLHRGQPALVPLVGVGFLLELEDWPTLPDDPVMRLDTLGRYIADRLPPDEQDALRVLAALKPGYPARLVDEKMARRLGWLCPGASPDVSGTLHPSVVGRLYGHRAGALRTAHERIAKTLAEAGDRSPSLSAYASAHLLTHALDAFDRGDVRRLLFDRKAMTTLIQGDLPAFTATVARHVKVIPELAELHRRLKAPMGSLELIDHARAAFAPAGTFFGWPGDVERAAGIDGRGVRVAVVSTGVDASHPELQHLRIDGVRDDGNGHGTSVASLIAGRFIGIAPGVALRSLAPMDTQGKGEMSSFSAALDSLLALPPDQRPDIVCLPFGGETPDESMAHLLRLLADSGVLLIGAAGNDGRPALSFPASLSEVMAVGALTPDGRPHTFSNQLAELWAFGDALVAIPMAVSGSADVVKGADGILAAPYTRQTGTSFACAAVAGLAALYAQATGLRGQALRELMVYASGGAQAAKWDPGAARAVAGEMLVPDLERPAPVAEVVDEGGPDGASPMALPFSVLWVDDRPQNNVHERQMLAQYGARFVLALSTEEAIERAGPQRFDVIISDMGRPKDARAGYTLLGRLREAGDLTPYVIYAGSRATAHREEAVRRGALGCTNMPEELLQYVLSAIGRGDATPTA